MRHIAPLHGVRQMAAHPGGRRRLPRHRRRPDLLLSLAKTAAGHPRRGHAPPLGKTRRSDRGRAGLRGSCRRLRGQCRLRCRPGRGARFVELGAAPRPISVTYDRAASTMALASTSDFDWPSIVDTRMLHVSGITLGLSASCREVAKHAMQEARRAGATVTFDVNYRQKLWDRKAAAAAVREVAPLIDVLISTEEDARDLFDVKGAQDLGVET